jgi:hypothetical protein
VTVEQERILKLTRALEEFVAIESSSGGGVERVVVTKRSTETGKVTREAWERSVYNFGKYAFEWCGYVE